MAEKIRNIIPIVFSVDDNYAPFLGVALSSIKENASDENFYKIYVLNTEISEGNKAKLSSYNSDNFLVKFVDVAGRMDKINKDKIHLRDYYSKAIYYRIFIPSLFPDYEKILYIDCDVVVLQDIANLYNTDVKGNIFVAMHEETMTEMDVFGRYSEEFLGVKRENYFNSGILLINCEEYDKANIEERFINFMHKYKFEVAPDQDYLNVLCKDRIKYLDVGWNKTPFPNRPFDDKDLRLIHYKLNFKPWHYSGVRYEEYFWKYAKLSPFYTELYEMLLNFSDKERRLETQAFITLQNTALRYIGGQDNYKTFFKEKA